MYLRQEGRGLGWPNKLCAYNLQDMGFDTVSAQPAAPPSTAWPHLRAAHGTPDLGVKRNIRLLTNNPDKIETTPQTPGSRCRRACACARSTWLADAFAPFFGASCALPTFFLPFSATTSPASTSSEPRQRPKAKSTTNLHRQAFYRHAA